MADTIRPFVYFGQNKEKVFLTVDIKDVSNPVVNLTEDELHVQAHGVGVRGKNDYSLDIEFYLPVDPNSSKYKVTGRHIEFQIQKVGVGECWPRLLVDNRKHGWLKIDFDHFSFADDTSSEEEPEAGLDEKQAQKVMLDRIEREMKEAEVSAFADMKTLYLFVYNLFQFVGFAYIWIVLVVRLFKYGEEAQYEAYKSVGAQLMVVQLGAIMEVLHPFCGLVRTGAFMPAMQVFGRNLILFGLIAQEPKLQDRGVIFYLFLAWSSVELVRYPFYMLSTVNTEWKFVTWLRYTVWIPLYPMGFMCEGFVMLLALPYFEKTSKWSIALPNRANFAFHFPTFLKVYMVLFLVGMYMLMGRMYEQRKVKIPPSKAQHRWVGKKSKTS